VYYAPVGRRKLLGAALALAALVAASAAFPHGAGLRPMQLVGPAKAPGPLLAFVQHHGAQWLAPVDGATLRLTRRPAVRLGFAGAWSYSPDGGALAVAARTYENGADVVRFVDPARLRATGRGIPLDGNARFLSWTAPDRIVALVNRCCSDESTLVRIDTAARRVVGQERLDGAVVAGACGGDALVLLLGPSGRVGPARLLVAGADGSQTIPLDVTAGMHWDESTNPPLGTQRVPALTVDAQGRRAFVVTPELRVAEIDLRTLAVSYHQLTRSDSLFGALGGWLVPAAAAKGMNGPAREARWLGDGQLALTGSDWSATITSQGGETMSVRPAGLDIVDTTSWSVHRLDPGASYAWVADGLLLATGAAWSEDGQHHSADGIGLTAYGADGTKRFQLFGGREAWLSQAYAGRAYVGMPNESRLRVVDLASGAVVGQRGQQLPWLLLGQSSQF
jgi:hypothetical protein